jgi:hypothetical protein
MMFVMLVKLIDARCSNFGPLLLAGWAQSIDVPWPPLQ